MKNFFSIEYEAQSVDLEKEVQDALTSRKDLESTNEGIVPVNPLSLSNYKFSVFATMHFLQKKWGEAVKM